MTIKRPKKAKVVPTEKQKKAAVAIAANGCKAEGIREAGYSEVMARNPARVTESEGYKEAARPIIEQLEELRQKAIKKALSTMDEAGHGDSMRTIDLTTKNIQLLGGKATKNVVIDLKAIKDLTNDEVKEQLNEAVNG